MKSIPTKIFGGSNYTKEQLQELKQIAIQENIPISDWDGSLFGCMNVKKAIFKTPSLVFNGKTFENFQGSGEYDKSNPDHFKIKDFEHFKITLIKFIKHYKNIQNDNNRN